MEGMTSSQLIQEMLEKSKLAAEKEEATGEPGSALVPAIFSSNSIPSSSDLSTATNVRQDALVRLPPTPHPVFTGASVHESGRDLVAIHTRAASQSGGVFFQGLECLDTRPITRNTSYATGICKSWGNITKVDNVSIALPGTERIQTPGIVKSALRRISSHKFDKRESKLALPRRGSTPKPTDCLELKVVLSKSDQIFSPDTLKPTFPTKSGSFRRGDYSDQKFTFLSTQREKSNSLMKVVKTGAESVAEKPASKEMLLTSREATTAKKPGGNVGMSGGGGGVSAGGGGGGGGTAESATSEGGRSNLKRESRKIKALDTTAVFPSENVSVIAKTELFESKDACPVKTSSIKRDKPNVDPSKDKSPRLLQGDISAFSTSNV